MYKITCPFCFTQFTLREVRFRCMNLTCPGRSHDHIYAYARGYEHIVMGRVLLRSKSWLLRDIECDICKTTSHTLLCPNCHFQLPDDIGQTDQCAIAIIGGRATGKTHYIAALIARLQNEVGKNFGITVRMLGDDTQQRWQRDFYTPLFVHKTLLHSSLPAEVDPRVAFPLIFRLSFTVNGRKRTLNISFFDSAGEDMASFATMSTVYYRYISYANGIIFLLDPLQIPALQHQLPSVNLPAFDMAASPENMVVRLHHLFEKERHLHTSQKVKIPVAFTLSKIDTLLSLLDPGSSLHRPGSHPGYLNLNEVESMSTEVANYLKMWISSNFCNIIKDDFACYSYFAMSSLGESPDVNNRIQVVSPLRVEDPFLWLLYKLHVVKGRKS